MPTSHPTHSHTQHRRLPPQSKTYLAERDIDVVFARTKEARDKVLAGLTPAAMLAAARRLLPLPARSRYTAITLVPRRPAGRLAGALAGAGAALAAAKSALDALRAAAARRPASFAAAVPSAAATVAAVALAAGWGGGAVAAALRRAGL